MKAIGKFSSFSIIIKCDTPFNACGTHFFIFSISLFDKNRCVALTESSHTSNNLFINIGVLLLLLKFSYFSSTFYYIK